MRFKLLTIAAAMLALAACESAPDQSAVTTGGGDTTSSSNGSSSTASGAIAGPVAGTQEDLLVEVGDRVFFNYDESGIRDDQRATMGKLAAWLNANPGVSLRIEGHADERGTREYNLALGERRANAAKEYLVSLGINPNRLSTISYGEERPAVLGSNEAAWAQNRRAVFKVR